MGKKLSDDCFKSLYKATPAGIRAPKNHPRLVDTTASGDDGASASGSSDGALTCPRTPSCCRHTHPEPRTRTLREAYLSECCSLVVAVCVCVCVEQMVSLPPRPPR